MNRLIDTKIDRAVPYFADIAELLRFRAEQQPDNPAYTFLPDGENEEVNITFDELDRGARAIAAWLAQRVEPGDRVLLVYPPGIEYLTVFYGCLYLGAIAVPM